MSETFAELLARHRERAGLSMQGLGCLMTPDGQGHCMISRLESGQRRPSPDYIDRLTAALDLTETERAQMMVAAGYWPGERGAVLALDALAAARAAGVGNKWG